MADTNIHTELIEYTDNAEGATHIANWLNNEDVVVVNINSYYNRVSGANNLIIAYYN